MKGNMILSFFICLFFLSSCSLIFRFEGKQKDVEEENDEEGTEIPLSCGGGAFLNNVSAISSGWYHTCALLNTGTVKCWGWNIYGQLGDGTNTDRNSPVEVLSLTGVSAISAGNYHTCALLGSGGVKCWGRNNSGQLGDGTTTTRMTAVDVVGLPLGVTMISCGDSHTCAILGNEGVKCWGRNSEGQLGDGTNTQRNTPVDVLDLPNGILSISAGGAHTCGLLNTGGVRCWGSNIRGQLGDGTNLNRNTPVYVSGLSSGVSSISAGGNYTCAVLTTGDVKCWGNNSYGQLGDGTNEEKNTPVNVVEASGISAIATGDLHTCAFNTVNIKCWGWNEYGQLGDGTDEDRNKPVGVMEVTEILAVSAGRGHSCAVLITGDVKCWGRNENGELGDKTNTNKFTPVFVCP